MADEEGGLVSERSENDESYRRTLMALFKNLRSQALSNAEYFQDGRSHNSERFHGSFRRLYEHLDRGIEPGIEAMMLIVHLYDFDPQTPANGYRSMIKVIHKCCLKILQLTRYITVNRASFLFRSGHYSRELEAYVTTLGQLRACLYYIERLLSYSNGRELFPDEETLPAEDYATAERLMMEVETLCQESFYGRCLAFQYCESMARPLTTIVVAMASFADSHLTNSSMLKMASTILGSGKYIMDQELRAQQIVNVTRNGDIKFLKDFWSVAESDFLHQLPLYVCPQVTVDKVVTIQPETFELARTDGSGYAKITPPCAHSGPSPVYTRLISYKLRQGQDRWFTKPPTNTPQPPSPCLLLHCHGGGFVAQSSATHQVYLRHWAKDLNIPILSVDYSLAPEFPFPRQLEEIFYAYCWAIRNRASLGWTGERVCFAGDSAGGNLIVATAMRTLALKVKPPDGIMSIYGVMIVRYCPSPSRIMALMDPLLSVGVMANCLSAYSGVGQSTLVSVPYYHGTSHHSSKTTTPATPRDAPSPLLTSSISPLHNKPITRHKSTTSGDSGFHDLVKSDSSRSVSDSARSVRSRESGEEGASTSTVRRSFSESEVSGGERLGYSLSKIDLHTSTVSEEDEEEVREEEGKGRRRGNCDASSPKVEFSIDGEGNGDGEEEEEERRRSQSESSVKPVESPDSGLSQEESGMSQEESGLSPTSGEARPVRSSMWLDFGGFFGGRSRERTITKSPSSPATLMMGDSSRTPPDQRITSVSARLRRLRLCRSVRFTLWLVTGDLFSYYLPCLQLHYRSPFAHMSGSLSHEEFSRNPPTYAQIRHFAQSPVVQFRHMPIAKNPYMSPFLAPDSLLLDLPPCYFVACHLDPMLDDSVAMAQRLRSLGRDVTLTVLDDLPHGFLNFNLLSPEAKRGSDVIVQQIRHILKLDDIDWNQFDVISAADVEEASRAMEDDVMMMAGEDVHVNIPRDDDVIPAVHHDVPRSASTGFKIKVAPCAPCL